MRHHLPDSNYIGDEIEEYEDIDVHLQSRLPKKPRPEAPQSSDEANPLPIQQSNKENGAGRKHTKNADRKDEKTKKPAIDQDEEANLDREYQYYYPGSLATAGAR